MHIKPLAALFKEKYEEYWRIIFPLQYSGTPASFVFMEAAVTSGYRPQKDEIILALCGWDIQGIHADDGSLQTPPWSVDIAWRRELMHEICHEVQCKLRAALNEAEGENFRIQAGIEFPGNGHDAFFYSAIIYVAERLNIPAETLVRRI